MPWFRTHRPSAALVVSIIALIVALGGTAYAGGLVGKNSVGTKQLRKNAVTTAKIHNGAITAKKLKKGLLVPHAQRADFANGASAAFTAGRASSADTAGSAGALTGVNVVRSAATINPTRQQTFVQANCKPGQFVVGGGAWTDGTVNESVNSSWPTRQAATDTAPDAWGVWMNNNEPSDNLVYAYAICVSGAVASSYSGFHAVHK
ncbi:MAG: hypothetical protein QOF83_124 [Solirubrobacteraceae bacterium]|jgi:hypothetical protein|nr:hypothetical protein [Solirubrobacteraceae bacterium]